MNIVSRKEKKFLITLDKYHKHINYLSKVMSADKHNDNNGYMVRSLYFDTLEDYDFESKADGLEIRKKIRLRTYDVNMDYALFEIKQKQGEHQLKRSLQISKSDANLIIKGNYSALLKYNESLALELYGIMNTQFYRPKAVVQYIRKAYVAPENKIRITFDSNIVATESNFDIFNNNLLMYPVMSNFMTIMEVKYTNFLLSYIKDALMLNEQPELSVSKYMLARSIGKNYNI